MVKIAQWLFATRSDSATTIQQFHPPKERNDRYAYGFTYSYKSSTQARYGTRKNLGEDTVFVGELRLLGGTIHQIHDSSNVDKAIVLKRVDEKFGNISGVYCDKDCTHKGVSDYYELFQKQCD